jgi:3-deoxy-D-manno-octulosonic-acid transferase
MNALDVIYTLGVAALSPVWARKARSGWRERMGKFDALPAPTPGRKRLVLHAVSLGEVSALRQLVPILDAHVEVVIATTTDTGFKRAGELFGKDHHVVRYPLDFSSSVRRFLDAVRPDGVALVELEVWPNFISACARSGIPVGVINGRLSERSFRGYRKIRPVMKSSFASLAFAGVQDEAYAERFAHMGVLRERVIITDTMKWDTASIADDAPGSAELAQSLGIDRSRPIIVAGSTAQGEEELLHRACPAGVQLLCAPRKPERFDEAAAALPGCVRRSVTKTGKPPAGGGRGVDGSGLARRGSGDRFLLDTLGELRAAYALADVAVVGRSFVPLGGSDPIEPVGLGKATIIGPEHANFTTTVAALSKAGGLRVVNPGGVRVALESLLRDKPAREAMASKGRACIVAHQGATRRSAELILRMLGVKGG